MNNNIERFNALKQKWEVVLGHELDMIKQIEKTIEPHKKAKRKAMLYIRYYDKKINQV